MEKIKLSNGIVITITNINGNRATVGIEAPKHVLVSRSEPCVVCHTACFDHYLGYKDIPFCGDERCGHRIRCQRASEGKQ